MWCAYVYNFIRRKVLVNKEQLLICSKLVIIILFAIWITEYTYSTLTAVHKLNLRMCPVLTWLIIQRSLIIHCALVQTFQFDTCMCVYTILYIQPLAKLCISVTRAQLRLSTTACTRIHGRYNRWRLARPSGKFPVPRIYTQCLISAAYWDKLLVFDGFLRSG